MSWEPARGMKAPYARRTGFLLTLFTLSAAFWSAQSQPPFGPPEFYPVGLEPIDIAIGDFNGDQIPDLVTAHHRQAEIAIVPGLGDRSFGPPTFVGVGGAQHDVTCGDLNGDQILDLALPFGGTVGRVSVLLGIGDGTFGPRTSYYVGSSPISVEVVDLNGDQISDLVVSNFGSDNLAVLLGYGDGTFGPASFYDCGSMPRDVAVGDLNGDRIPDLVTAAMNSDRVGVLLGAGDGTFGPLNLYVAGEQPWSVALGDFNGDEVLDIAVTNSGYPGLDFLGVLLGVGDGTFETVTFYRVGDGPHTIAIADFYSDGVLDLIVANEYSDTVSVLLGNGNGTFGPPTNYWTGNGPSSVAVGDLDGNQIPDLALADANEDAVAIFLGAAGGAGVDGSLQAPLFSRLSSVSPNPISGQATIDFDLREPTRARLRILDVNGRVVNCLLDQNCLAGGNRIVWDLSQGGALQMPVGTYFLSLDAGGHKSVQRITIVR